ncbi:MAG: antitoxin AF2212-like protein [Euryarchaeota archaeon]|nr:antitoxin AF2212-like protein [Euryarchaeota archaeon]
MTGTIAAIYDDGIFKHLRKVTFPEHKRMRLVVLPEEDGELLELQKKELSSMIGIGKGGVSDVSRRHDQYILRDDTCLTCSS